MIWLIGMMGAGKTAVGAELAVRLGIPHVDTDDEIERRASATIPTLFETVGEPTFRLFEAAVVRDLADAGRQVVLLEARDRVGGRTYSTHFDAAGLNVDLGAEWVDPEQHQAMT